MAGWRELGWSQSAAFAWLTMPDWAFSLRDRWVMRFGSGAAFRAEYPLEQICLLLKINDTPNLRGNSLVSRKLLPS